MAWQPKDNLNQKNYSVECAECGSVNLHHFMVQVYERQEDADKGLHVTVCEGEITIDDNLAGNPSRRRNGLVISLRCEQCENVTKMSLCQHKGISLLERYPAGL